MSEDNPSYKAGMDLMNSVNPMGFSPEEFANAVTSSHRTLQQNAMKAMMACMTAWAEIADNGYYDLRNEATVLAAKKIVDATKDDHIPFI